MAQHINLTRFFVPLLSERINEELNFIQVLLGPRQVGKTTGATEVYENWGGSKHFATADRIAPPDSGWIDIQWRTARSLSGPVLLVLDEIQKIPGWDERVKILFDQDRAARKLRVVLLGSASTSIQKGLSEGLTGRFELIKVPHWSYSECKQAFSWGLEEFLMFGGYPAPAETIDEIDRWQALLRDGIIEPVLLRDIQGLVQINKPALFRQTFELALGYPAQEISLQKLLGQLQDRGNVTTIQHYLHLFAGAFLMKTLHKYSTKQIVERQSSPKILPLCPALVHAHANPLKIRTDPEWFGRVFELAIGAHLANLAAGRLFYWRSRNEEVDYVLETDDATYAIEVKSGRKSKNSGLAAFSKQFSSAAPRVLDRAKGEEFLLLDSANKIREFLANG